MIEPLKEMQRIDRRGKVRVISSRKATVKERKLYETY